MEHGSRATGNLAAKSHLTIMDPASLYDSFIDAFISASKHISTSCPKSRPPKEPRHPWWNSDCSIAVTKARKAEMKWRRSPLSLGKRSAWEKAEVLKKKL